MGKPSSHRAMGYGTRKRRASLAKEAFGNRCACCGYSKHVSVLAFHHLNPKKKEERIAAMIGQKCWKDVVRELRKCILVCPTCHEELDQGLRQLPKKLRRFDESYSTYLDARGLLVGVTNCPQPKIPLKRRCEWCKEWFENKERSRRFCCRSCATQWTCAKRYNH